MSLSPEIVTVLAIFQSAFTCPTWDKAQVLIIGTLLARGRRTVTAALRQLGRVDEAEPVARKALEIYQRLGTAEGLASAYSSLGNILREKGKLEDAEEMHRRSLELEQRLGLTRTPG